MMKSKVGRTRNETLSLRIDPKLRYRLDLVAGIEDRTITSVIDRMAASYFDEAMSPDFPEWFSDTPGLMEKISRNGFRYFQLESLLWSDDEAIRALRYCISFPGKLNARERVASKALLSKKFRGQDRVWDEADLWDALIIETPTDGSTFYTIVNLDLIHEYWKDINDAVDEVMKTGLYKPILDIIEGRK